jgi:site-specific DNA recombinase
MKCLIYIRVSTEEQATGGVSLDAQRARAIAYAAAVDLAVVEVIEDAGVSAKTLARPGLRRALAMLQAGAADALLVAKLDRLSRSVGDWQLLIERYFGERGGKQLLSVADSIDTRTAGGRLVLNVLVSVSQWEREAIAERTRDALRQVRADGVALGQVPLGFRRGDDGRLEPVDEETATVARARELAAGGMRPAGIARQLAAEGRRTKRGGQWAGWTVQKLLARASK